eukprot:scaffold14807_cov214-Skeletonema_menzelii.AAC.2
MCQPPPKEASTTSMNKNKRPSFQSGKSFRYPRSTHPIEDLPTLDPSHVPYRIAAKYILRELERLDICAPKMVIVTNAAGGLKEAYNVGDVAIIRDHIALPLLCGKNPLVGQNDEELGPRFPPTSNLYDVTLQNIVMDVARGMDFDQYLHKNGTYAFVSGPQYESKSECAMLRMLGADAVGMSTVPEILAAHHSGMAVLCLSLITNKVVYYDEEEDETKKKVEHANHAEVLTAVQGRGEQMVKLVGEVVKKCGEVYLPTLKELDPICLETEGRVREQEVVVGSGSGEKKTMTNMLCPYHLVKGILSAPAHCLVLGGSILAAGVVVGMKMSKH